MADQRQLDARSLFCGGHLSTASLSLFSPPGAISCATCPKWLVHDSDVLFAGLRFCDDPPLLAHVYAVPYRTSSLRPRRGIHHDAIKPESLSAITLHSFLDARPPARESLGVVFALAELLGQYVLAQESTFESGGWP